MAELVKFAVDDGSEVSFESAESDLVALHSYKVQRPGTSTHPSARSAIVEGRSSRRVGMSDFDPIVT